MKIEITLQSYNSKVTIAEMLLDLAEVIRESSIAQLNRENQNFGSEVADRIEISYKRISNRSIHGNIRLLKQFNHIKTISYVQEIKSWSAGDYTPQ